MKKTLERFYVIFLNLSELTKYYQPRLNAYRVVKVCWQKRHYGKMEELLQTLLNQMRKRGGNVLQHRWGVRRGAYTGWSKASIERTEQ